MDSSTIRYGFIGGILLIAEMLVTAALASAGKLAISVASLTAGHQLTDAETNTLLALGGTTLALYIGTPLVAGSLAARKTGSAKSGAWAGTLVMFISGLAILVAMFIAPIDYSNIQTYVPTGSDLLRIRALTVLIGGGILVLIRVLFGAIVGGFGGLIGRIFYREPRRSYSDDDPLYESYLPLPFSTGQQYRSRSYYERQETWRNRRYFSALSPDQLLDR